MRRQRSETMFGYAIAVGIVSTMGMQTRILSESVCTVIHAMACVATVIHLCTNKMMIIWSYDHIRVCDARDNDVRGRTVTRVRGETVEGLGYGSLEHRKTWPYPRAESSDLINREHVWNPTW